MRRSGLVALLLLLGACNGDLRIISCGEDKQVCAPGEQGKALPGLPVRLPEPFIALGYLMQHTSKEVAACKLVATVQSLSLPSRQLVYLQPQTAIFAKTAFSAEFSPEGALTKISFNSEPAGADNIKAVTELAKTAAGLVGLGAGAKLAVAPGEENKEKKVVAELPCNSGAVVMLYAPLQDVLDRKVTHPPPPG